MATMSDSPKATVLPALTGHAVSRMHARSIDAAVVDQVLMYGRIVHTRGAEIHVIGRKEVACLQRQGVKLHRCEGVHVICSPEGTVITVYRNHNLAGLREKSRRCWH